MTGGGDSTEDYDLDGDYYVLYGVGNNGPVAGSLLTHSGTADPIISSFQVNPFAKAVASACK